MRIIAEQGANWDAYLWVAYPAVGTKRLRNYLEGQCDKTPSGSSLDNGPHQPVVRLVRWSCRLRRPSAFGRPPCPRGSNRRAHCRCLLARLLGLPSQPRPRRPLQRDNPLASTTFCFIGSAYGVPISYMLYVDAFGFARGGITGGLAIDAFTGIIASGLLGLMLLRLSRDPRRRLTNPTGIGTSAVPVKSTQ